MRENEIIAAEVIKALADPQKSAQQIAQRVMDKAQIAPDQIHCSVGTGYGRKHIDIAQHQESEISCHAKAAHWQNRSVRMVIDIGGQDAKAIRLNEAGEVVRYAYNDKCASGTGRFLEIIAQTLDLSLDQLGQLSEMVQNEINLSNQCVVFAETEIISLVNEGKEIADIVAALHRAVCNRVGSLAKGITIEREVTMSGGVAKNQGMFNALARALQVPLVPLEYPQINGALGACLIAREIGSQGA